MNSYKIVLLRGNDKELPYTLTDIKANSEEEAIDKAKMAIAECGYWPRNTSIEERMSVLFVDSIEINK